MQGFHILSYMQRKLNHVTITEIYAKNLIKLQSLYMHLDPNH